MNLQRCQPAKAEDEDGKSARGHGPKQVKQQRQLESGREGTDNNFYMYGRVERARETASENGSELR